MMKVDGGLPAIYSYKGMSKRKVWNGDPKQDFKPINSNRRPEEIPSEGSGSLIIRSGCSFFPGIV